MDWLPNGVRLTAYSGEASDLTQIELRGFLDAVAGGRARVPIARTFTLEEIVQAHTLMESGTAGGKIVVLPRQSPAPTPKGPHSRERGPFGCAAWVT